LLPEALLEIPHSPDPTYRSQFDSLAALYVGVASVLVEDGVSNSDGIDAAYEGYK
jgi:hypothetical protein